MSNGIAAAELTAFVERVERLEEEKREVADQIKEVKAEAKGRGYCVQTINQIVALRKKKPDDIAEAEAMIEMYKSAMGMA